MCISEVFESCKTIKWNACTFNFIIIDLKFCILTTPITLSVNYSHLNVTDDDQRNSHNGDKSMIILNLHLRCITSLIYDVNMYTITKLQTFETLDKMSTLRDSTFIETTTLNYSKAMVNCHFVTIRTHFGCILITEIVNFAIYIRLIDEQ